MTTTMTKPNGYDIAFMTWFHRNGWKIWRMASGIEVWTNDDAHCHFIVTDGMLDRLEGAGSIKRVFPDRPGEWWIANGHGQ